MKSSPFSMRETPLSMRSTPKIVFWSDHEVQVIPEPLRRFLEDTAQVPGFEIPDLAHDLMRQAREALAAMGETDPDLSTVGKTAIGLAF